MTTQRFATGLLLMTLSACGGNDDSPGSGATTTSGGHQGGAGTGGSGGGLGAGGAGEGGSGGSGGIDDYVPHALQGKCDLVWQIGGEAKQHLGTIAAIEDIDGDGKRDLVASHAAGDDKVSVEILSGATGARTHLLTLDGQGWVAPLERDLDGDGVSEIAVFHAVAEGGGQGGGAISNPTMTQSLSIVSPKTGAILFEKTGAEGDTGFAMGAALVEDENGDGAPELAIGSAGDSFGNVVDYSMSAGEPVRTMAVPASASVWFGTTLRAPGDLDGDGVADRLVGDPSGAGFLGQLFALSGIDDALLWTVTGVDSGGPDLLGNPIELAGDLDGDGTVDVVVGVHNHNVSTAFEGRILAISGRTGETLWSHDGDVGGAHLGLSIASAGDVDGDGVPDVLAGAPTPPVSGVFGQPGRFTILSGADGTTLVTVEEPVPEGGAFLLGESVAGMGDVNGDSHPEIAVSAPGAPWKGAEEAGRILVYDCRP